MRGGIRPRAGAAGPGRDRRVTVGIRLHDRVLPPAQTAAGGWKVPCY